jgi:phenylpropionate dioxygenase-like ring-hydroxylating dioxygenase large terminal subunit
MAHFAKPAEGSWTEHSPGLGTEPVSYRDSYDPEHWQAEIDTIFTKEWLNIGRVEQLPRVGSYFTRELTWAKKSIVVVKDRDGTVRAFHNVCRHRGNKLMWDDYPGEETSGVCRQMTCKYHAWRYDLDGSLSFVQQESEFFDLDKASLGLAPVACDVWEGFIFVNLDPEPTQTLSEALAPLAEGLAGYPFGEMTQTYKVRAEINSNWKLFIDAFVEFYHAPVLHQRQATADEAQKLAGYGFEALHYELYSPHSMVSSWGGMSPPKDLEMVKPIERIVRGGLFGPWDRPDLVGATSELPPLVNPSRHRAWGTDSFVIWPNFMILIWAPGWYLTYHYWPLGPSKHLFETTLNFVPPRSARERLAQELTFSTFKEYALQDANTLEATQTMLESGAVDTFVLNDQEILCRHHHAAARVQVAAGRRPDRYPWMPAPASA